MNDTTWHIAAFIVVGLQLLMPLVTGVPIMVWGNVDDEPKPEGETKRRKNLLPKARPIVTRRDVAPLQPLVCAKCHAPVPLLSSSFPCPFCNAPVAPPPEYVAALADRAQADNELARAERLWRWSRVTSSPWLLWPVRVLAVAWALTVGFFCIALSGDDHWFVQVPGPVLALAGIITFFEILVGMALIQVFADTRKTLPKVPKRAELRCAIENGTCRGCGSPIQFAADRLAAVCNYCEADNYRAALAQQQRDEAAADKKRASGSLLDAVRDTHMRRHETLVFFVFLAIAEIFYAVVFTLVAIGDWIGL